MANYYGEKNTKNNDDNRNLLPKSTAYCDMKIVSFVAMQLLEKNMKKFLCRCLAICAKHVYGIMFYAKMQCKLFR